MTTRRAFLAASAAVAAAPGLVSAATPSATFDVAAFNALLDRDAPHKHLFTATKIDRGDLLDAVRNTLNAYRDSGVPFAQIAPVAVLYHGASIALAMDDHAWDTYLIPTFATLAKEAPDAAKDLNAVMSAKTKGNPLLRRKTDNDSSIQSLASDGLHFFVCNNALHGFSQVLASERKLIPADVYADVAGHLLPNASIVPAGVWAIHTIQERKYTLLQTS